ncbi:ribbon-helix-helix protein, CopG family [Virgibacillus proomii]|nr:ribbon-helix-helix protein, CopG family [Virgibacillus proomii]MBU5266278.1 ribbon-helix-helix protein, CopG family [Virgibacillus proomii]
MKKVNFNIRIEEELREQFKKTAEENVQNPSALVRRWISEYVEKHKKDS